MNPCSTEHEDLFMAFLRRASWRGLEAQTDATPDPRIEADNMRVRGLVRRLGIFVAVIRGSSSF